ncbi:hypothetical protein HA402_015943 [Bradysia odoriphaga]|uniref:lipopolysaccharide-induced tumor necrosis factor-alpha factor-like n=1 Tax=Bradysia coprophila TaxID=38358 RepID=UPI00187DCC1A|nr:lipopolysaccharide-induced tumor necrosis factor-alpha factor-like [Bradysia coprophila]XP_037046411.1 lipopolysaccharide-induced tumor necrosis factor-alpha factor-like [Bradysia coprophila]KAG4076956.1 hypothetical protein HA402_015943 [Bradysia odoriphaga]
MDPKGQPQNAPPAGFYVPPQPPPAYEAGQTNYQFQPQQQHLVQHVITTPNVGPNPCSILCPSCRQHVVTRMDYETSTKTHIMAGLLCAFICWPCAWIPYVMDSCKNANHYCPNCGCFIGTYKS